MQISELKTENGEYNGTIIEVKSFISFLEKKILCLNVLENCMDVDDNGMIVCDYFVRKLVKDINIVKQYTNIEISDSDYISDYDFLVQNGILNDILSKIDKDEKTFIDEVIEREIKQRMETVNSFANIIGNKLQQLIDKIPNDKQLKSLSKSLIKDINKLDWDKVPMLKQMWLTANGKSGEKVG